MLLLQEARQRRRHEGQPLVDQVRLADQMLLTLDLLVVSAHEV